MTLDEIRHQLATARDIPKAAVKEAIRRCLKAGDWYEPLVDKDSPPDDIEPWAIGFATALDVRPESWDAVGRHRNAGIAAASIAMLLPHEDLADGDDEVLGPLEDDEGRTIAGNLPQLVHMCYAFWHGLPVPPLVSPRRSQKVGRNEPCPLRFGAQIQEVLRCQCDELMQTGPGRG